MNQVYFDTARLMTQVAPFVFANQVFALKVGTAINLFIRDMPRLSVDLDLVFRDHTVPREQALEQITGALRQSAERLKSQGFQTHTVPPMDASETKLLVRRGNTEVKIEVNFVMRGTLHPVRAASLTARAREALFADLELPVASPEDVFGGKLVAALDRQHPRDLFDVMQLFAHEGIAPGIRRAFNVYLASHNRLVHEVLFPLLRDISQDYELTFKGMTADPIALRELLVTREQLIHQLHEGLDKNERNFLLFDVQNGNPNGDPDADNAPHVDPETGNGLVTDVCIKRKIRNYVGMTRNFDSPHNIFVKERGILANVQRDAHQELGIEPDGKSIDKARSYMCKHYFDVRTFGAVMTTGKAESEADAELNKGRKSKGATKLWNCGQVRGPVQFGFGSSIDPVMSIAHTITRVALTNATDAGQQAVTGEDGEDRAGSGQIGRKHGIPCGLYRMHGFISPFLASDTGFSKADLGVLLEALQHLFDHDRSASRGEMSTRGLFLFEHESKLGNAPAHRVLDTVNIGSVKAARHFSDYEPHIIAPEDGSEPLSGVTCWHYA